MKELIGVAVTNKTGRALARIYSCLKDKPTRRRIAKRIKSLNVDAEASLAARQPY